MLAVGGALGGLFVGLAAPLIFNRYLELPIAITGCIVLAMALLYRLPPRRLLRLGVMAVIAFVASTLLGSYAAGDRLRVRNFYGALHVSDAGAGSMTSAHAAQRRHRSRQPVPFAGEIARGHHLLRTLSPARGWRSSFRAHGRSESVSSAWAPARSRVTAARATPIASTNSIPP